MKTLDIINQEGKRVDDLKLNQKLFDGFVNKALVHEAIVMYQANLRIGSANTKTRDEVRGGGKKPWKQKGTGRARASSIRSPLWRGGGVTFGPKPRNYSYKMPKKALRGALRSLINDKINEKKLIIIEELQLSSHKTKDLISILNKLKLKFDNEKILIVVKSVDEKLKKASSNLKKVSFIRALEINAYKAILAEKIVIEKSAFKEIEKRISQ